jgi:SAM-dependent methyltransferase
MRSLGESTRLLPAHSNTCRQLNGSVGVTTCRFCGESRRCLTRFSSFKHDFLRCDACETISRTSKAKYPGDAILRLLSKSSPGQKVVARFLSRFSRRGTTEHDQYGKQGEYFEWIMNPETQATGFVAVKRQAYFRQPAEVLNVFAANDVDLSSRSVLDVSGGPGTFAFLIKDRLGSLAVTEYHPGAVMGMQAYLPGVRVFQADLNDEWQDEETFDVVLYRSVVVFASDFRKHFRGLARKVAPGGLVYIYSALPTLGNALRWQYEDYTFNVLYSPSVISAVLAENGFRQVDYGESSEYRHFLRFFTPSEAAVHLYGVWNRLMPGGPRDFSARAFWILARKIV